MCVLSAAEDDDQEEGEELVRGRDLSPEEVAKRQQWERLASTGYGVQLGVDYPPSLPSFLPPSLPPVTRVRSQGHVKINLNVVTKDLWQQGYRNGAREPGSSVPIPPRESANVRLPPVLTDRVI